VKVVIAGGGTAGHVFPAVALADRLRDDGVDVSFVGSADGQEARLVPAAGYDFHAIAAQKMVRELSARTLKAPFVALTSIGACRPLVRGSRVVVGLGGYTSAPVVVAGRREHARVVLVEQNAVPGLANRLLAHTADALALTFAGARRRFPKRVRSEVTGNPVRAPILAVPEQRDALRREACTAFDLDPARRTVAVFGGSQGALRLDRVVAEALPSLAGRHDLQLLVATGPAHLDMVEARIERDASLLVRAIGFVERMDLALAIADIAVARAGSGHIAELTVCGVPSILVPYPHATEHHQEANARELVAAGAAELLPESRLSPEELVRRILALVDDDDRRGAMRVAARGWAKPDADARLSELVREVAR
jgi:UDP-N-acetylglucosamine--N-acetylmuramyl-(pentapeptide) pyrophosphoryl-undecaprenol N-acetylglucosamine transferase